MNTKLLTRLYLFLSCGLAINEMFRRYNDGQFALAVYYVVLAAAIVVALLGTPAINFNSITFVMVWFFVHSVLVSLINGVGLVDSLISGTWILSFLFAYSDKKTYLSHKKYKCDLKWLFLYFIVLSICLNLNIYINTSSVVQGWTNLREVSFVLCIALLILQYIAIEQSLLIESITSVSLLVLCLLSFKRTSILIVLVGLLTYYYSKYITINKRKKNKVSVVFFALFIAVAMVLVINEISGGFIQYRFSVASETGGNGRIAIWEDILQRFAVSNIFQMFFGHGFLATNTGGLGYTAHNDFIEILFDYGLLGLCMYLAVYFFLVKELIRRRRHRDKRYPVSLFCFVAFLITSLFSHIVIYPTYNILFMFVVGTIFSEDLALVDK